MNVLTMIRWRLVPEAVATKGSLSITGDSQRGRTVNGLRLCVAPYFRAYRQRLGQ